MFPRKASVVLVGLLLAAVAGRAQEPPADDAALARREAQLRLRLAMAATDQRARCELGFVLVRRGHAQDAVPELDAAIAALGTPADDAGKRLLAACTYNRGRAAEFLDDVVGACEQYRRSLALRPSQTVADRLRALDPATASSDTLVARAVQLAIASCAAAHSGCAADPEHRPSLAAAGACDDGSRWVIVPLTTSTAGESQVYELVALHGDASAVRELCEGDPGYNDLRLGVTAAVTLLAPARCGVVVDHTAAWWIAWQGPGHDGFDAEDDERVVL